MKIGIVTVVYSGYPYILFNSIGDNSAHRLSWHIHSHTTDRVLENQLATFCLDHVAELSLHRWNRGLARSWNDGILASYAEHCDYTLVVNDDIAFIPGGLDRFIEFLGRQGEFGLGFLHGRETAASPFPGTVLDQGFACFAFGPRAYHELGAFDENFFPAYSEDIDYVTRARLAGIPIVVEPSVLVEHARNHTTSTAPELRAAMAHFKQENSRYFAQKWGGSEDAPGFTQPWQHLPLKIDWQDRHHPYGPVLDRPELARAEGERLSLRSGPCRPVAVASRPDDRARAAVATATVRAIYKSLLLREPEDVALTNYSNLLLSGACTIDELIEAVHASEEFRSAGMGAARA